MTTPTKRHTSCARRKTLKERHAACLAGQIAEVAGVTHGTLYKEVARLARALQLPIEKRNGRWVRVA